LLFIYDRKGNQTIEATRKVSIQDQNIIAIDTNSLLLAQTKSIMKTIINSTHAPNPIGPYNHSVLAGNTLYISGQIGFNQATGQLVTDNIEDETHQVMNNLKHILTEAGMTFENIAKCSVFVADMEMYGRINAVYASYFNDDTAPARELVQVANLPRYVNVEISAIAVK
jgi:2-iminobutanoate/2-iminopropanoate deaminase